LRDTSFGSDKWWTWSALLFAPTLTCINLSVTYAFTPALCKFGGTPALHLLAAGCALATMMMTAGSVKTWHDSEDDPNGDEADAAARRNLLSELASIVAALSTLVVLAQWAAVWIVSPCP
jgi:hypothetical protein